MSNNIISTKPTSLVDLLNNFKTIFNVIKRDTATDYPSTSTGEPNSQSKPGAPTRFFQTYTDDNTYINNSHQKLVDSLSTNVVELDVEIPYKPLEDPTVYPLTTNHTEGDRGWFSNPSQPPKKFTQPYNPGNTYLDHIKNYI